MKNNNEKTNIQKVFYAISLLHIPEGTRISVMDADGVINVEITSRGNGFERTNFQPEYFKEARIFDITRSIANDLLELYS